MSEPGKIPVGKLAVGLGLCLIGLTWLSLALNATFRHASESLAGQRPVPAGHVQDYAIPLVLVGIGAHLVVHAIRGK